MGGPLAMWDAAFSRECGRGEAGGEVERVATCAALLARPGALPALAVRRSTRADARLNAATLRPASISAAGGC